MQMNRNILQFSTKLKKSQLKKSQNKNYLEKTLFNFQPLYCSNFKQKIRKIQCINLKKLVSRPFSPKTSVKDFSQKKSFE